MRRLALIFLLATVVFAGAVTRAEATGVWSAPRQLDSTGAGVAGSYLAVCTSDALCFGASGASLGPVAYHVSPGGASSTAYQFGLINPFGSGDNTVSLESLACPSASLCVGVANYSNDEDAVNDVVASTLPAAGPSSWVEQNVEQGTDSPAQLSCPTTTLCVGAGTTGNVVFSQDPTGGAGAWTSTQLPTQLDDIDCPSTTFCAAYDDVGEVWTSTDPTGGATAWTESTAPAPLAATAMAGSVASGGIEATLVPEDLACTGPNLCIATSGSGSILVSTDPGGATGWTSVPVSQATVSAVDCAAGSTLCLAGDSAGNIATSDDGAGAAWTSVPTAAPGISSLSCLAQTCIAAPLGQAGGAPLLASVPAGTSAWQWKALSVVTHHALSSVSCPSAHECIGADPSRYYASVDPGEGLSSWHARVEVNQFHDGAAGTLDSACYSATGCLAAVDDVGSGGLADVAGGDLVRFDPAGGAHAFHDTGLDQNATQFVACAQGTCVAGIPGQWLQSSHPVFNKGWVRVKSPRFDVTCLKPGGVSCVALADGPFPGVAGPDLLVAAHRAGPWSTQAIDPGGQITGLACTSAEACVVVDAAGRLLVSTTPMAGASSWHLSVSDPDGFNGVACETARVCVAVGDDGEVVVGRP